MLLLYLMLFYCILLYSIVFDSILFYSRPLGGEAAAKSSHVVKQLRVVTMELFMQVGCSLVGDVVMTKMSTVIGCYGFLLWPMTVRAFYKLLWVPEVDSPPRCEKT